ncbi:MAG: GNAT family N-acetyltransferase [Coriobacteriales bacterium]|nr:GNAT family N-acetyltransferase [Coriobacteriales bacterium]
MIIRRAQEADIPGLHKLLRQVLEVHADGRPDIFKHGSVKFTNNELREMIAKGDMLIFVAASDDAQPGELLGHLFCEAIQHKDSTNLTDIRTLYIHDLCVDENARGQHVGTKLYDFIVTYAREHGFYNITLNVWACNEGALRFYEARGLVPQKYGMETIL